MQVSIGTGAAARSRVENAPEAEKPGVGTVRSAEVRNQAARLETFGRAMGPL